MMEQVITIVLSAVGLYMLLGINFYLGIYLKNMKKLDPGTDDTSKVFKLLIAPGFMIFWPIFFKKWREL